MRKGCGEKGTRQKTNKQKKKNDTKDATSLHEANSDNENAFVTRATHSTVPFAPPSNDYLLPSANWITPELRENGE